MCVASVKHQILPSDKLMSNFHRTKAKDKNVCIMTLLQQLLPSNNTVGSRLPLVIVMNFKSLPLFFIPDHRRGSLDVWFKDEPTFAGGREPQDFSPVSPAASTTLCTVLPDTHLNCSPVQDEQRHGDGVWDAHERRSMCSISREATLRRQQKQKGKDPWRWSHAAEMYLMSEINRSVLLSPRMERKHVSLMEKSHLTYISWPSHSKQACPWNERRRTEPFV